MASVSTSVTKWKVWVETKGPRQLWKNLGHMTGHALAAWTAGGVMCVRLNGNGVRTILGIGPMAHHAHFVDGLAQHGVVVSTAAIGEAVAVR